MAGLTHAATLGGMPGIEPIAGLEVFQTVGGAVLQGYSGTGALRGTWTLGSGTAQAASSHDPGSGYGIARLSLEFASGARLLTDDQLGRIVTAGDLTIALDQSAFSLFRVETAWIENGTKDWLFAEDPTGGLVRFSVPQSALSGSSTLPLAGKATAVTGAIDDLLVLDHGGAEYLITAAATEDAVDVWRVNSTGALSKTGSAPKGQGIDAPSALAEMRVNGSDYVVVAGAGSGSLSVYKLTASGGLQMTDHVLDDALVTRFSGANVLETAELGGRSYLLAAGNDQGLSILTLLPGGKLVHLASLGDSPATTLGAVSTITTHVTDGTLQIFAASTNETGVTQLVFDPGPAGQTRIGGSGADTLTGGAGGDVLMGNGGNDTIEGGGGDDILHDGAGIDRLTGGAGADLFILTADDQRDTITDYEPGKDRLDLSHFDMFYGAAQLKVIPTSYGARLEYRDEEIRVYSADGQTLEATDFPTVKVTDLQRPPSGNYVEKVLVSGTGGADTLIGAEANIQLLGFGGDDVLGSQAGQNILDGGSGQDRADYSGASGAVEADLASGLAVIDDTWSDQLVAIEHLIGSAYNDILTGDGAANDLSGLAGADSLLGGSGTDDLRGGTGADTLRGGGDADTLYGNTSADELYGEDGDDELRGGDGVDMLHGGAGNDFIIGHNGWDQAWGGSGSDTLYGSSGADQLNGGDGNDSLYGGTAVDTLSGDAGDDLIYGNQGADHLYGNAGNDELWGGSGVDTLYGGADADTLYGNEGADHHYGGAGGDLIFGGTGDDLEYGEAGNDTLYGGQGVDTLSGGAGDDFLRGGTLADTFIYTEGHDQIDDFRAFQDRLQLDDALWAGTLSVQAVLDRFGTTSNGDYVLDFGAANTLTFNDGVDPQELASAIEIF